MTSARRNEASMHTVTTGQRVHPCLSTGFTDMHMHTCIHCHLFHCAVQSMVQLAASFYFAKQARAE
eukprot:m.119121 g.119121  ORF g.119121 m.119121 type:complete len:66 (-) comp13671_c0_seq1:301-498(-)